MIKRKPFHAEPSKIQRFPELTIGNRTLNQGDLCKVRGLRGYYEFVFHCSDTETGAECVDVRGPVHNPRPRTVAVERIKMLPKRRKK